MMAIETRACLKYIGNRGVYVWTISALVSINHLKCINIFKENNKPTQNRATQLFLHIADIISFPVSW